ncbi:MAG TPA: MazG nucleotide pyrophosphohydrolase domain-containing protein [Candidatus Thermoplasmatota archaeon]|nr:MazG nucleotide pyrophosphohydrolase domain-containing protein [Candidatus Thermoplasmatota archaeon]
MPRIAPGMHGLKGAEPFGPDVDLSEIQRRLDGRFGAGDRSAGLPFLVLVLQEEVGEVAEAVRKGDRGSAAREAVDALFVALSLANAAGADAEALLRAKFLDRPIGDVAASWTDVPAGRSRGAGDDAPPGDHPR